MSDFITEFIVFSFYFILITISFLFFVCSFFVTIKWFFEFFMDKDKDLFTFIILLTYFLFSVGPLLIMLDEFFLRTPYLSYVGLVLLCSSIAIFICAGFIQEIKEKKLLKKEFFYSENNPFNRITEQQLDVFINDPCFLIINGGSPKNSSSIIVTNNFNDGHVIINYDGYYMEKTVEFQSNVLNWLNYKWDWCVNYTPNNFWLEKNIDDGLFIFKKLIYDYDSKKIKNNLSLSEEDLNIIKSMGVTDDFIELSNNLRPKYDTEVRENIGYNVLQNFADADSALGGIMFSKFKYMNRNCSSPLLLQFIVSNTVCDIKQRMLVRVFSKYGLVVFEKHVFEDDNYVPKNIIYSSVRSSEELFNLIKQISIQ